MRITAAAIALTVFLLTFSPSASAQSLVVEVTASESGNPLAGVFVSLLDLEGRVVRSGLSNEAGRFVFPLSRKDTFRVQAELIGRETRVSGTVAPGEQDYMTVSLALSVHAIALDAIRVDSDERCRLRPDEASEIIRLWEEVRKALAVQAWSQREGLYRLDVSTYERDLDDTAGRVEHENRRGTSRVTRVPFASLSAQELANGGFVRPLSDGAYEYYGPDAALLLSDDFLDTHCFRTTRSLDHHGAVGLAFEPVRAGEFSDIRGTLWVDEVTAALRLVEFRYTQLPYAEGEGMAGGRVEFERLPDGAWMIQKWWIRAPILVRHHNLARAGDTGIRVAGIRETGGEVVGVSSLERRRITRVRRGSLRGVVWDSSASKPLAGATVYLVGTPHRVDTDSAGRFMLNGVPDGLYTVGFTHVRLDTLGIDPPGMEAEVAAGATVAVELAIPPMEALLLAACRNDEREDHGAALSGTVTDGVRGGPVPGARVRMEWQEVTHAPVPRAVNRWLEVGTDSNGRYTACGVPIDQSIRIRAILLKSEGPVVETRFLEAAHQPLDLMIALPAVAAVGTDDAGISARRFAQGVQGTIVDRESGDPITAEVSVRDASGKVVATGVTNERGFFRLPTATSGRYFLSAEALGYGRIENAVVEVTEGRLSEFEIGIAREALELEPVVVAAESRAFRLEVEGFYRRMDSGFGRFMTPKIFEDRRPRRVTDLLYGVPGAYVADPNTGMGGRAVYFRSGIRASSFSGATLRPDDVCWPMIYVDRQLVSNGGQVATGAEPAALDEVVHPSDVWAMEVYRSPAEVPPEFNGAHAGCGVIVLWTRRSGG